MGHRGWKDINAMKVLVTGGAGYMGSALVPLLLAQGHQVRVADNLLYGGGGLLGSVSHPNFELQAADLRDRQAAECAVEGVDAVVHLAAIVGDPACAEQPSLAREVNLDATLQLLQASQTQGAGRFVFASTCSNYGKMRDPSEFLTEESPLRPTSVYAETKVAAEAALLDSAGNSHCAPTILRFATLFGLSPRPRFDLTVNEFTVKLLTDRQLVVYGAQFWRPYVHVRDAARAICLTLDAPTGKVSSPIYNVGDSRENYQKGQLVDLIRAKIGEPVKIEYIQKVEDPRDYRVSFDKIARELGFQITRTVDDGITEIIGAICSGIIAEPNHPAYTNVHNKDD